MNTQQLATPLRRARTDRRLTQAEVAEAVGITRRTLAKLEDGGNTTTDTANRLADYYQQTLDQLFRKTTTV